MRAKVIATIVLIMLVSGCATMRKEHDMKVKELQNRIIFLETKIEKNNQKITDLEQRWAKIQNPESRKQNNEAPMQLSASQIQSALKKAGFYNGPIDGKMGRMTKKAIKSFQKFHGLAPDGIVGAMTNSKLRSYL